MTSELAVQAIIDGCSELGIPFMIVGSLSSNYYGIPRSTQDADFVVAMKPGDLQSLVARLGSEFQLDPQPSFECVTMTTRYLLKIAMLSFTIELFLLSDEEYDQERFRRRVEVEIHGRRACVASAEDVIVTKLNWYHIDRRSKDLDDVHTVIAVQGNELDWPYIESWCDRHGSREHLERLRALVANSGV
jgi:Nucleotidyl transferase of unknown function (DUF2204)